MTKIKAEEIADFRGIEAVLGGISAQGQLTIASLDCCATTTTCNRTITLG